MKKADIDVSQIKALFDADLHLGHKKNRLHPKARKFVYKIESGISIIDLTFTAKQLETVKDFLKKAGKDNQTVLFVATKKVASTFTTELCEKNGLSFITNKWLPGLLTNFETIIKNVKKLKELKEQKGSGEWEKLVKHERVKLNKNIIRLNKFYGGLINLEKRPDVLFVLDAKKEKNAIIEAKRMNIPVVAVIDTNANPEDVDYPIIANDDSPTAVEYLMTEIVNSYVKGKSKVQSSNVK